MDWLHSRLSLIILSLLFPIPHSFVIRKRSVDLDFMTDQQLAEAIRERDRDRDMDKAEEELNDDEYLYSGSRRYHESMPMEMFLRHPEGDEDEGGLEEKGGQEDSDEDERVSMDTGRLLSEDEMGEEEEEEETDGPMTLVGKSELEDLFEKPSKNKKSSLESEKDNYGLQDATKSELTKEEMRKLFEIAEPKTGIRKVITETKVMVSSSNGSNVPPTYQGVKVIEVATEKNDGDGIRKETETKWIVTPGGKEKTMMAEGGLGGVQQQLSRSWLGNLLEDAKKEEKEIRGKRKMKRSEMSTNEEFVEGNEILSPDEEEKEEEAEEAEEAETERNVDLLKAYIKLQTAENEHLEEALNLAIATQVGQTDDYLVDEISHLKMAVQDEDALQTIKDAIKGQEETRNEDGYNDEDNFKLLYDTQEDVDDDGVNEEDADGDDDDDDNDDDDISNQQLINAKLKKFLIYSAENNLNGEEQEIGNQPDEEEDEDDKDEDDDDDEETLREENRLEHSYARARVLNPFTRNPLETDFVKMKRSGSTPETYVDEDDDSVRRAAAAAGVGSLNNLDITDLLSSPATDQIDFCPAIQELTDNCLAARQEGLVLDNEAMDLCNRHQLCYYCGSVFGMNADSCDRGYLGESELLCTPKEICKEEAAGLYLIMMKKHRFISSPQFAPYICAAQCVYDYIVGVAERGRR